MIANSDKIDGPTIQNAKETIRSIVQTIAKISRSNPEPEQYYRKVLDRIVMAMGAIGGAVWTINSKRQLQLDYQINLSRHLLDGESEDGRRHDRLLHQVMITGEPRLVPPMSGPRDLEGPGNPTQALLVLAPLKTPHSTEGVLEVFQRPDSHIDSEQACLRFLVNMSEFVGDWLISRKLVQFAGYQEKWAKIDYFSKEVHNSLNLRDTAYTIANEARRLIECDRVSVTLMRRHKQVVEAISGQDTIDTRSSIVTMLSTLATRVSVTREQLWYSGSTRDLPPQLETALDHYIDESHTKSLAVLPLCRPDPFKKQRDTGFDADEHSSPHSAQVGVIGCLIVEQISDVQSRDLVAPVVDLICQHSARALGNAIEYDNLFLMPLWRTIGRSRWLVATRHLPKTLVILGLILSTLLALFLVPKDFVLQADGTLEPVEQSRVFVKEGGEVTSVLVKADEHKHLYVEKDEPLVQLTNSELEKEIEKVRGDLESFRASLQVVQQILAVTPNSSVDRAASQGDVLVQKADLIERTRGAEVQLQILEEKKRKLTIVSPIKGQVTTFDVERLLLNRPVTIGEEVMQVANLAGDWELEVYLRDNLMGHLLSAQKAQTTEHVPVSFVLKSHAGETFVGELVEIQNVGTQDELHGHSFRLKVRVDKNTIQQRLQLKELAKGLQVRAQLHCGTCSIAYYWFHELLEWIQLRLFTI